MKKALAITLACVMAAGVLGGCSGKGGEKTTEGVTGGNSEAATETEKGEKTESAASGEKKMCIRDRSSAEGSVYRTKWHK